MSNKLIMLLGEILDASDMIGFPPNDGEDEIEIDKEPNETKIFVIGVTSVTCNIKKRSA